MNVISALAPQRSKDVLYAKENVPLAVVNLELCVFEKDFLLCADTESINEDILGVLPRLALFFRHGRLTARKVSDARSAELHFALQCLRLHVEN